jgi:gamma-glutamyltranspeptidase
MKGWKLAIDGDPVKQFSDMRLLPARDRSQARSMVLSDRGIVATSQTLESQAGAQVLARGSSAIDAAITANAQKLKGKPSGLPR